MSAFSQAPTPISTRSVSIAEKIKRSEEYYLPSGDIIFLVENYLYRVHRYFFERESPYFRHRFSAPAPPGQAPKGSSDSNPYPLEDILALDFSRFLWVFYNQKYSVYEASGDEWISILKLACEWGFDEVKRFAVRELETKYTEPLDKIRLYHRFHVDKQLLIPSYIAMALRPEPLTLAEGRALGLETALAITRAREYARGALVAPKNGEPAHREAAKVVLDVPRMEALVREVFLSPDAELPEAPPPAPETIPRAASQYNGAYGPGAPAYGGPAGARSVTPSGVSVGASHYGTPHDTPRGGHTRNLSSASVAGAPNELSTGSTGAPAPAPLLQRDLSMNWNSVSSSPTMYGNGSAPMSAAPEPVRPAPELAVPQSPMTPRRAGKAGSTPEPVPAAADYKTAEEGTSVAAGEQQQEQEQQEDNWFGLSKKKKTGPAGKKLGGR